MNFFKALLITNIIILILIVPSFIVLDKYLARHNDTSVSNIIASPENSDSGVIDLNNEEPVATPSTAPTEKPFPFQMNSSQLITVLNGKF